MRSLALVGQTIDSCNRTFVIWQRRQSETQREKLRQEQEAFDFAHGEGRDGNRRRSFSTIFNMNELHRFIYQQASNGAEQPSLPPGFIGPVLPPHFSSYIGQEYVEGGSLSEPMVSVMFHCA